MAMMTRSGVTSTPGPGAAGVPNVRLEFAYDVVAPESSQQGGEGVMSS